MSLSFNDWLQTTYRPESGGLAGYGNFGQINSNASGLTQGKMQMAYNRGPGGEITGQFLRDNRVGNNIYQSDDNYAGLPQANYQFGDTNVLGGVGGQPYMRSRDGAFLGYGDLAGLNSDQRLNNEYSQYIAQDPALEAQRIQNQQAEQDLFEQQQAARAAQQAALPSVSNVGASQLTGIPANFGGFGGAMPGFTAPQGQQQGLLTGALHRGAQGGTGLLGGGGQ
jgi:hypothetical protein